LKSRNKFEWAQHELANGLRVVVSPDRVAPVAAMSVWYDVGSRHERPGRTGFAHLFEHLMFEGSTNVAAGEHMSLVQDLGGSVNGTTNTERTNYVQTVAVEQLELMLYLEADRMGGLLDRVTQESLDKQRDIVKNERRQRYDNQPYGKAPEQLVALLFPVGHPYHHMPIGSMEDLDAALLEDVHEFFRTYYTPDNAVVSVVGDVDPDEVFALVEQHFSQIPRGTGRPEAPDASLEGVDAAAQRITLREPVPAAAVYMGFRAPAERDPAADHMSVAGSLLGNGYASTLYQRLVNAELAKLVQFSVDHRVAGASAAFLTSVARDGVGVEALEAVIRAELQRLADDGPTPVELARAKAMKERSCLSELSSLHGRADALAAATTLWADPGRINTLVDRLLATTAADVRGVVGQYLVDGGGAVVEYVPMRQGVAA
jgi:predicted Zn-dependent peptidase